MMQRGITRPRSPDDTGDSERPKNRSKQSPSNLGSESAANPSSSHQTTSPTSPKAKMGHQLPPFNGISSASNSNGNGNGVAGPSTNGHSQMEGLVKTGGELMYEDDQDWAAYQALEEYGEDNAESGGMDGQSGRRPLKGAAAAKRMPVNREEVVRLILQGLKDMGYRSVQYSLSSLCATAYRLVNRPRR
jgi:hypothetical protein